MPRILLLVLSLAGSLPLVLLGLVLITGGFFAGHAVASSAVSKTATHGRAQQERGDKPRQPLIGGYLDPRRMKSDEILNRRARRGDHERHLDAGSHPAEQDSGQHPAPLGRGYHW